MDSPLFLIAVVLTGLGIAGAAVVAPLVAAWWARSSAPAWSATTAMLAVSLVVAVVADRALSRAGGPGTAALPAIAAVLLAVGPIVASALALASARRTGHEIPPRLFATYLVPLVAFCAGLALYVAAGVQALSSEPGLGTGTVSGAITVLAVWVAGVVLVGVLAGTIALTIGLLRSRHREVSP